MKQFSIILFLIPFLVFGQEIDLRGEWEYQIGKSGDWKKVQLPKDFEMINSEMKHDDFLSIRRQIDVPLSMLDIRTVRLQLERVDTYCRILVNGDLLDTLKNFFVPCDIDIKESLLPGENELQLEFIPAKWVMENHWRKTNAEFSSKRKKLDVEMHVRRPRNNFNGPAFGIYGNMRVKAFDHIQLKMVNFKLLTESDGKAKVLVKVRADIYESGEFKFESNYFNHEVKSLAGHDRDMIWTFYIENFSYWYPKGMGDQNYIQDIVKVSYKRLGGNAFEEELKEPYRVGFHKIEYMQDPKEKDQIKFELNGDQIIVNMAMYTHKDYTDPAVQEKYYANFFKYTTETKVNMINVTGKGGYPTNRFYEICDSLGLMVWQEFAFSGLGYPSDSLLYQNARKEIEFQMRRIDQFPSVTIFAGSSNTTQYFEDESAMTTYEMTKKDLKFLEQGKDDFLGRIIPTSMKKFNGRLYYKMESPDFRKGEKGLYSFGYLKLLNY